MTDPDLLKFAQRMFELSDWPAGGDIGMFEFQAAAVECGLLKTRTCYAPCGENCGCADFYGSDGMKDGVTCFRKHPILEKQP